MKTFKYYIYTTLLATVFSCTYDFPEKEESTSGGADFTKYVSVGNSLTAGFMDGALYDRGQANSFTSILAGQMKLVGGGDFNQPDINSPAGFFRFAPDGQTPLGRLILQSPGGVCGPSPSPIVPGNLPQPFSGDLSQLNNFGVPGLTLGTALLPQTGGPANGNPYYNPYYARFAS
ncbi:MAG TPA: hypothetical protein VD908_05830, partial [Cytophagales bacterium]|nr:hypothetical protein [Cytophagales bacterium]